MSGATLAELSEDEYSEMVESHKTVKDLKQVLANRIGYSRFRQRLLGELELQDDMPLIPLPDGVQIVILDFCPPDSLRQQMLVKCCEKNDLEEVERLLHRPQDPNGVGIDGNVPIHVAAENGHVDMVRLLVEARADKNTTMARGETALHCAAKHQGQGAHERPHFETAGAPIYS